MNSNELKSAAEYIYDELRLKTLPLAAAFYDHLPEWPEKTRRPSKSLNKRITVCQAVTLTRIYRWTVGLTSEDIVCVPALLAFGHAPAENPKKLLSKFFAKVGWSKDEERAAIDVNRMSFMSKGQAKAILLSPLRKGLFVPDTIAIYGNPAQIMRLVHAWTYMTGESISSEFSGKVECSEYLAAPYLTDEAKVVIPGNGDRLMSGTQDDELVFALPGKKLQLLTEGLDKAGRALGARYPVPFYQNFQPDFPPQFMELAEEAGLNINEEAQERGK